GSAAGVIRTQDLSEKDPERNQRGEDPVQPAAQRRQRLGNHVFGEDVGERQVTVLKDLASQKPCLGVDGSGVRISDPGGLLAWQGSFGNFHPRKGGSFCLSHFRIEACGKLRAIRRSDRRRLGIASEYATADLRPVHLTTLVNWQNAWQNGKSARSA